MEGRDRGHKNLLKSLKELLAIFREMFKRGRDDVGDLGESVQNPETGGRTD